jgi:hypothetical protein
MPIVLPLVAAVLGGFLGVLVFSSYLRSMQRGKAAVLFVLIFIAFAAFVIPNAGQQLYEFGMSFSAIDVLNGVSYFVFSFAIVCAWMSMRPSRSRWLLVALIPVSFAQPLLWTLVIIGWSIRGFV